MKLFKHGENLALLIPESTKKRSELSENDDFEIIEVEKGCFIIISKANLAEQAKRSVIAQLAEKTMNSKGSNENSIETSHTQTSQKFQPYSKPANFNSSSSSKTGSALANQIFVKGYRIIENEEEAKEMSRALEESIKQEKIIGVRGFDKKFYIVSSNYYDHVSKLVLSALATKQKQTLAEIAAQAKTPEDGTLATLQILKEKGEIIESRKNLFEAIN